LKNERKNGLNSEVEAALNRATAYLPNQEKRPEQIHMTQVIRRFLDFAQEPGQALMVEAGTGTGKSFAYLVAVCEWLMEEKRKNNTKAKAVIATYTLALEDQLIKKDVPVIKRLYPDLCFEKAQGRTNYVCRHKLNQIIGETNLFSEGEDTYNQLLDWLARTKTGERNELTFNPGPVWNQICSNTDCLGASCPNRQSCYYQQMKEKINKADVIITTHAMVMTDLIIRSLPDYQVLILDEAHNIEKSAYSASTTSVSLNSVLSAIKKPIVKSFCHFALKKSRMVSKIKQWQRETELIAESFFAEVEKTRQSQPALRLYEPCFETHLKNALEAGIAFLQLASENIDSDVVDAEMSVVIDELGSLAESIDTFINMYEPSYVYWIDENGINYCPIDISDFLGRLFKPRVTVLTSATLTVAGSFNTFKKSVGLPNAYSCKYASSFDYANNSVVYVPPRAPSPKSEEYINYLIEQISSILDLTKGKTFILFTSYKTMNEVYQGISSKLSGFVWLVQGMDTKERLLQSYRTCSNAVLFGVDSYWEGIDEDINCVVITKMPFSVPTNPLEEAQYERVKSHGGNPFMEKAVPQCAIKLKQGTGRLIRHKQKRGAIAILDPRIHCNWGNQIKKTLPFTSWTQDIKAIAKYV